MNPYFLMAILFLFMAGFGALASALTGFQLLPWFNGLRWLRVHLITLGALTEAIFGILPVLASVRMERRNPGVRWDIWLALTAGLLLLLVGIPLINYVLIVTGGTLIFLATLLLMAALRELSPAQNIPTRNPGQGRIFYLAGLAYLLVGIIIGSGLWFGWGNALRIAVPIEAHIHANSWGFMSLIFAGLVVDLYPRWTGQSLAWPRSIQPIFWLMALGAFALVLGPWLASNWVSAPGLILHLAATIWLLANMIKPVLGTQVTRHPGIWHLITSYTWQLAPVLIAPLIIAKVPGFPGAGIEQSAPQALIYGWVLQFGYAVLPYVLSRAVAPNREAGLGGSWFSLAAVHAGALFLWGSIFITSLSPFLQGIAYLLWFFSMLPILRQVWQILASGLKPGEEDIEAISSLPASKQG